MTNYVKLKTPNDKLNHFFPQRPSSSSVQSCASKPAPTETCGSFVTAMIRAFQRTRPEEEHVFFSSGVWTLYVFMLYCMYCISCLFLSVIYVVPHWHPVPSCICADALARFSKALPRRRHDSGYFGAAQSAVRYCRSARCIADHTHTYYRR